MIEEEEPIIVESEETNDNDISNKEKEIDRILSEERDCVPEEDGASCIVDGISITEVANYVRLNNYNEREDECVNDAKSESSTESESMREELRKDKRCVNAGENSKTEEDKKDMKAGAERSQY